jgi:hypothetical protein
MFHTNASHLISPATLSVKCVNFRQGGLEFRDELSVRSLQGRSAPDKHIIEPIPAVRAKHLQCCRPETALGLITHYSFPYLSGHGVSDAHGRAFLIRNNFIWRLIYL